MHIQLHTHMKTYTRREQRIETCPPPPHATVLQLISAFVRDYIHKDVIDVGASA
eukprot:NODE_3533_length_357_cov_22.159091_g3451_i0.p4 GENE.NODE_3533_length_357_cov_22.159091_g3451_i0~~NODE_3533_length_357_cov_22.159091_g3451_i0.p4  ORF type:complete len:54 (-),score=1.19 NODE_3533_length_357_cov_22.159091_g3451_i0:152-313(-)